jgi:two-component system nitrogen regulation sensor histidine kinase NtrY
MASEAPQNLEDSSLKRTPRWLRKALVASRRSNIFGVLEVLSLIALLVMAGVSWVALSATPAPGELIPSGQAAALLVGTLIPALSLIVLWGRRVAIRRAGGSTARLHVRLVFFFSMVAAVPTLLVAIFASVLFQVGVEFWFSDKSRGIFENANELAREFYDENQRDVGNETIAMASDIRSYLERGAITDPNFEIEYSYQVIGRELTASAILQKSQDGELLTAAIVDPDNDPSRQRVPTEMLERVEAGEQVVIWIRDNQIEAITPIDRQTGIYLYNTRSSEAEPLGAWQQAQSVLQDYDALTNDARTLQLQFNLALFVASLALVGIAVWFALRFADRQVKPLTELVLAARDVGAGNYALRVEGRTGSDEIGLLNRAFNRMTAQIEQQTSALVSANRQLEDRRHFIETMLESITAGIMSIGQDGEVLLMNSSAQKLLLDKAGPAPTGARIHDLSPQISALIDAGLSSGLVQYSKDGELLTLAVKIAVAANGQVVTFEDITRQLLDQRQAAWSDVARRIAHEIKNPLTPIQLATERLNRRYKKQIESDPELFEELTTTIIRQVGDLRKMVDEFSSFARLPKPIFRQEDAVDLVRQSLFLQEVARQDIQYSFEAAEGIAPIACDRHQFGQAMTNVLKNAAEAVEAQAKNAEIDFRGKIAVSVSSDEESLTVAVTDNGIGLPKDRERIVEPYVTTRDKGTGLGLAIVNKIIEEHGGEITFQSAESGGTFVTMRFARDPSSKSEGSEAAE